MRRFSYDPENEIKFKQSAVARCLVQMNFICFSILFYSCQKYRHEQKWLCRVEKNFAAVGQEGETPR